MGMGEIQLETAATVEHRECHHSVTYVIRGGRPMDLAHAISMLRHEKLCPSCEQRRVVGELLEREER